MVRRLAIFASGAGTNAENIIRYFQNSSTLIFPLVVSNNANAFVLERAKALHVPTFVFSKTDFADGHAVLQLLQQENIDGIVLAGFLLRVPQVLIDAFPRGIINLHPALLPKFGGKGMYGQHVHEAVLAAGEAETGISIHYVDGNYDTGSLIFQAKCPVLPHDTPDDVAARIHELEYAHFPHIISEVFEH